MTAEATLERRSARIVDLPGKHTGMYYSAARTCVITDIVIRNHYVTTDNDTI